MIEELSEEGEITDEKMIRSMTLHIKAVKHFEQQNKIDKVIKHLNGFTIMLDGLLEREQVSEKAHQTLTDETKKLIEIYQDET